MKEEFPQLAWKGYQDDFLSDWYSQNKLFRGGRQSGKTTMMVCEAKRFADAGFDILFLVNQSTMIHLIKEMYHGMFDEKPKFKIDTYDSLKNGKMMGYDIDVVIMDEFQYITLETYNNRIAPMMPKFVRASACKTTMSNHWLKTASAGQEALFDSIY